MRPSIVALFRVASVAVKAPDGVTTNLLDKLNPDVPK